MGAALLADFPLFKFALERCHKYMSGWHIFAALRAYVENGKGEWEDLLQAEGTLQVLRAIPEKNMKDLMENMWQYARFKVGVTQQRKIEN